jgi:hypothetical protein
MGTTQGNGLSPFASASPAQQSAHPFSLLQPQQPSSGPRFVTPMTGGAPVWATPVGGGNMYLPATGGPPIMGMP